MSSLKDWYRYVDSKARQRPGSDTPSEEKAPAEQSNAPSGESGEGAVDPPASEPEAGGEETLDVWSGILSSRRNPESKPTTGPLKPPVLSQDDVPADLPFVGAPIDMPPAPRFHLPEMEVAIPRFDDFVTPYTPEPPASTLASSPSAALESVSGPPAAPVSGQPAVPTPGTAPANVEVTPSTAAAPPAVEPEQGLSTAGPADAAPASSGAAATADDTAAGQSEPASERSSVEPEAVGIPPADSAPAMAATEPAAAASGVPVPDSEAARAGGARTVSPDRPASEPTLRGGGSQRLTPGTPEWEQERVERLARTFRDTLRALEQSLVVPRAATSPSSLSAELTRLVSAPPAEMPPAPEIEPPPAPEERAEPSVPAPASGVEAAIAELAEADAAALEAEAEATAADSVGIVEMELAAPGEAASAGEVEATAPVVEAPAPLHLVQPEPVEALAEPEPAAPVEQPLAAAVEMAGPGEAELPPVRDEVAAVRSEMAAGVPTPLPAPAPQDPEARRSIQEAALIRERLPEHMEMLLRIPTNEVAQNSYKSPFRESREELIRRLLDPQLTLEEAARILGVCPTTVRRYTNRGMLHCHRTPGNQRRFRMSDVLRFLEQFGDRIDRAAEARQFEQAA